MKKYGRFIILGALIVLFLLAVLISSSLNKNSTITLNGYARDVTAVRLASAKNALDGTGEFNETQCQNLGDLAKKFNSSSDYLDCSSPDSIYLATPDTSARNVLSLSDGNYTALFTTDKDFNVLINYEFTNDASAGFNKFGGRK